MSFGNLIFPRDNYISRGDLRLVQRIQRGRVFNPTVPILGDSAWIDTEAVGAGYNAFEFKGYVVGYVTVNWGDGSTPSLVGPTGEHNFAHIYGSPGKYLVSLTFSEGNEFYWMSSDKDAILARQIIKAYIDRTPPAQPPDAPFAMDVEEVT